MPLGALETDTPLSQASTRIFLFAHLRAAGGGGWQALDTQLRQVLAGWPQAGLVGSFMGLFGVSNQELFLLLSLPDQGEAPASVEAELHRRLPPGVALLDTVPLKATVRPANDAPLTRSGVYVFRFFDVAAGDVDQVVSLSDTAWHSFERGDDYGYRSEPMGLFRFADARAERGRMLLLTWYDGMASWERSRTPHPDATANFRRRAALSRSAIAFATRLTDTVAR